jgi:steroid 5-alpha reductase family enzyme
LAFLITIDWSAPLTTIGMMSGGAWTITFSDVLVAVGLFFLFWEIIKSTRSSHRSLVDHMLSTLVFIIGLVVFLLVPKAATSTFALLLLMSLVDVVGGYSVAIRTARRDLTVEREVA